jgi:hypothetical protein
MSSGPWLTALTVLWLLLMVVVVTLSSIYIPKLNRHLEQTSFTNPEAGSNGSGQDGSTGPTGSAGPTGATGGTAENIHYIYRSNILDNTVVSGTPLKLEWIDSVQDGGGITYLAGDFTFDQGGLYQVSVTSIGVDPTIATALEIWVGTTNDPGVSLSYSSVVSDGGTVQQGQLNALIDVTDGMTLSVWVRQTTGSPATLSQAFVPSCGFVLLVPT